jgi:hypothetical protein
MEDLFYAAKKKETCTVLQLSPELVVGPRNLYLPAFAAGWEAITPLTINFRLLWKGEIAITLEYLVKLRLGLVTTQIVVKISGPLSISKVTSQTDCYWVFLYQVLAQTILRFRPTRRKTQPVC